MTNPKFLYTPGDEIFGVSFTNNRIYFKVVDEYIHQNNTGCIMFSDCPTCIELNNTFTTRKKAEQCLLTHVNKCIIMYKKQLHKLKKISDRLRKEHKRKKEISNDS